MLWILLSLGTAVFSATEAALTRHGFERLVDALLCVPSPLWVNRGVLAADELAAMRATGR